MRRATLATVLLLPLPALAHDPSATSPGSLPLAGPLAAGTLLALYFLGALRHRMRRGRAGALPVRRFAAGLGGACLLVLAVCPPVEALIGASFARHMGQHMVLLLAVPPLLVLGRIDVALGALLRRAARPALRLPARIAARPVLAANLLLAAIWLWHLPGPWLAAEGDDLVHTLDHAMLVGASVLYWRGVLDRLGAVRSTRPAAAMVASFVLIVGTGFLGAVLTLAPVSLYGPTVGLVDQQWGGVLMWIPCGMVYAAALLWALDRWLDALGRAAGRRFAVPPAAPHPSPAGPAAKLTSPS